MNGLVHPQIKILSFTHPHVIPILYDFLFVEHNRERDVSVTALHNAACPTIYLHVKCLLILVLCAFFSKGVKVIGHDTAVIYGENATLLCQLTETDADVTRITWKKKTQETPEEKTFFSIRKTELSNALGERVQFIGNFAEKNGSIQIFRMRLLDDGIYTCIFNLFGVGTFETDINVKVFGMMACTIFQ